MDIFQEKKKQIRYLDANSNYDSRIHQAQEMIDSKSLK